tara:strand:- start:16 stop:267 length:252 start_codon:yes stop_codon:yes gene_type:complete
MLRYHIYKLYGVRSRKELFVMSIKRVWVDKENCICCGLAEVNCPEVFKIVDSNTVLEGIDFSLFENKIKEAAKECPVQAIKYE